MVGQVESLSDWVSKVKMNNDQSRINNSQLPKGYKQTEVEVIPEDWEVKQLRTVLKTNPQYGINAAAVAYQGDLPAYIRITDISEDGYFKPGKLLSVKHSSASPYFQSSSPSTQPVKSPAASKADISGW